MGVVYNALAAKANAMRSILGSSFALLLVACGAGHDDVPPTAQPAIENGGGGQPGAGGGDDATPACPNGMTDPNASALVFDGIDDYVTMGAAPSLGLDQLTIEAWVRRDGRGKTFSTGAGGLALVPIAGKGRGEGDGSNIDCNYTFGFAGDVLGADFEDAATGGNHPVTGKTAIPLGQWHHVAATYDGTTWRLYLDGRLDGEAKANATPRKDSAQHFGIGAALDTKGAPAGFLHGAVDEVRVWKRARNATEIASGVHARFVSGTADLVSRWALDAEGAGTSGAAVKDTIGAANGELKGGVTYAKGGAVLDMGTPPKATANPATVSASSAELSVAVEDGESQNASVTFHVRRIVDEDDFTVVVLPDTQYYTTEGAGREPIFHSQTQWIVDNRAAYNIKAVIHNGDIVDKGRELYQWGVADAAMKRLETIPGLADGLPFGVCVGNHDQVPFATVGGTDNFNTYFGTARFAKRPWFGGTFAAGKNDENWFTFNAGGLDFVVVNFQYSEGAREAPVLAWARRVFQQHPEAFGVVNSHAIVTPSGTFTPSGQSMYDALKDVPNVHLMTNGHFSAEARREDTFEGHTIQSMLADYQGRDNGGNGWFRIWEFSPANDELTVRTYSSSLKKFETDPQSEFTLKVNLKGAGGTFTPRGTVDAPLVMGGASVAKQAIDDLGPGQTYEWYATVTDCTHVVTTPVQKFKTAK
jgi:hypothetical protein